MEILGLWCLAYVIVGWCFASWHSPRLVDRRVSTLSALRTIVFLWTMWPIWLLLWSVRSPHESPDNVHGPD